jgi:hypothetical protein
MRTLFAGLEEAFDFFGGVPRELLFDQMASVITRDLRSQGGRLVENAEFLRFAAHWNFRIRACRSYRARTKGKVERPIRYLRQSFVYGRDFVSDDDLNSQAQDWLQRIANVRRHRTTQQPPLERFTEGEKAALLPLAFRHYHSLILMAGTNDDAPPPLPKIMVERRPWALTPVSRQVHCDEPARSDSHSAGPTSRCPAHWRHSTTCSPAWTADN